MIYSHAWVDWKSHDYCELRNSLLFSPAQNLWSNYQINSKIAKRVASRDGTALTVRRRRINQHKVRVALTTNFCDTSSMSWHANSENSVSDTPFRCQSIPHLPNYAPRHDVCRCGDVTPRVLNLCARKKLHEDVLWEWRYSSTHS